jgi:hypothetical protein
LSLVNIAHIHRFNGGGRDFEKAKSIPSNHNDCDHNECCDPRKSAFEAGPANFTQVFGLSGQKGSFGETDAECFRGFMLSDRSTEPK